MELGPAISQLGPLDLDFTVVETAGRRGLIRNGFLCTLETIDKNSKQS
jgi:hypothetical protein